MNIPKKITTKVREINMDEEKRVNSVIENSVDIAIHHAREILEYIDTYNDFLLGNDYAVQDMVDKVHEAIKILEDI